MCQKYFLFNNNVISFCLSVLDKKLETMASGSKEKKYRYCETSKVDAHLLNQVTKHVNHYELGSLARDLDIDEAVYSNIAVPKDRIYQVRNMCFCFTFRMQT